MAQTHKTWRRKLVVTAAVLAIIAAALYLAVLPAVARWKIGALLQTIGVADPSFQLGRVTLSHLNVGNAKLGSPEWLAIGDVNVQYTLASLWRGDVTDVEISDAVWRVRITDEGVDWGPRIDDAAEPDPTWPFKTVVVRNALLELDWKGEIHRFPITGTIRAESPTQLRIVLTTMVLERAADLDAEIVRRPDETSLSLALKQGDDRLALELAFPSQDQTSGVRIETSAHVRNVPLPARFQSIEIAGADLQAKAVYLPDKTIDHLNAVVTADRLQLGDRSNPDFAIEGFGLDLQLRGQVTNEQYVLSLLSPGRITIDRARYQISGDTIESEAVNLTVNSSAATPLLSVALANSPIHPIVRAGIKTTSPVSFSGQIMTGTIEHFDLALAANASSDQPWSIDSHLKFGPGRLDPFEIVSAEVDWSMDRPDAIDVHRASLDAGAHGRFRADDFSFNPQNPVLSMNLACEHVSLAPWVELLTGERLSAQGALDGRIDFVFNPHGSPAFSFGNGVLVADPPVGWVQVHDLQKLEQTVDQNLDRIDADQVVQQVKSNIIEGLRDYEFSFLRIDLEPTNDDVRCVIETSGRGRQAPHQEFASLRININSGFQATFNDAMAARSAWGRLKGGQ